MTLFQNDTDNDNVEISWFDEIVNGSNSHKDGKQILSELWQQITGEDMLSRLSTTKQRHAVKIWATLAHRCDISYPPSAHLKPITTETKHIIDIHELRYAIRHAVASYPPLFIVLLGLKTDLSYAFKSSKKLLKSAFQIEPKDIIIDNCSKHLILSNKTHQPAFYLCIDHNTSKIIISIRGTISVSDVLTDANAIAKPFCVYNVEGYVHEGIMAAARFLFDTVTTQLIKICNQFKTYQVIITGHSLGAGVAALLGIMYKDHPIIHTQNRLKVYAFASPPIASKQFIERNIGNDYIISIALGTDLVTRLSVESVKLMYLRLDEIMKCDRNTINNCMIYLQNTYDTVDTLEIDDTKLKLLFVKYEYDSHKRKCMYIIQLTDGNIIWSVTKRYNEFHRLNSIMQKKAKLLNVNLPHFPEKKTALKVEHKKHLAKERVRHFEPYINCLISKSEFLCIPVVRDFLSIPASTSKALELIKVLKEIQTPNPEEQLFPLGQIVWLVPKHAIQDDIVERRKCLMCLKKDDEVKDNDNENDIDMKQVRAKYKVVNSGSDLLSVGWHNVTVGFEELQNAMDNVLIGGGLKKSKRFDGSHYVLCEATGSKQLFHDLILDLPESLSCHMPNRYLWALDAHLTRGNLY